MAIIGTHMLVYTSEAEKLRETFADVFGWHHVDAGGGWLIFRLPASEIGVHPAEAGGGAGTHQISLMCDDLDTTTTELRAKGIEVKGEPRHEAFGICTTIVLPGGVEMMLYQPRHPLAAG